VKKISASVSKLSAMERTISGGKAENNIFERLHEVINGEWLVRYWGEWYQLRWWMWRRNGELWWWM
jgi:hypothetical protein